MHRAGHERGSVMIFYVCLDNIMSIDFDIINYEITVAMWRKLGSPYAHVCSQSLTIQLGLLVHFHLLLLQCSLESNLAVQK
jgi:hypothetical protein